MSNMFITINMQLFKRTGIGKYGTQASTNMLASVLSICTVLKKWRNEHHNTWASTCVPAHVCVSAWCWRGEDKARASTNVLVMSCHRAVCLDPTNVGIFRLPWKSENNQHLCGVNNPHVTAVLPKCHLFPAGRTQWEKDDTSARGSCAWLRNQFWFVYHYSEFDLESLCHATVATDSIIFFV